MIFPNFSYVEPGALAGSAHPRRWGVLVQEALEMLAEEGIEAIVSLDEFGLDPGIVQEFEMAYLHSPITDFSVPSMEQATEVLRFIEDCIAKSRPVVVHCAAGIGRTGTLLACYFVKKGMASKDAIHHIRELRPGSIETPEQEEFIHQFAQQTQSGN